MGLPEINILIVDDRKENLIALEAVLSSSKYKLVSANSGEEALKWILKEDFALILLDVQMPGLDGFETAQMIRSRTKSKDIPIIFITALSQTQESVLNGYSSGGIDFIFKPFHPNILKSKVDGFVNLHIAQMELQQKNEIIKSYTEDLEEAVAKRTKQLSASHERLKEEIEEKRKMVQIVKENEERYRQLVEKSPEAIFVMKMGKTKLSYINKTALKLFGAKCEQDILEQDFISFVHPEDHYLVEEICARIHAGESLNVISQRFIRLDGEVIDVEVKMIPLEYKREPSLHIVARDVTELKKSREIINQTEKLTVVGELAAGIAHEIRNPLTSLRGFTQLLNLTKTDSSSEYADIMLTEIDRINTIVSELLLLAKPNKEDFKAVNLLKILDNTVVLMNGQAVLKDVEITLHSKVGSDKACEFYGLADKMKQVFINIIQNSIEAMPNGGEISIHIFEEHKHYVVEFSDQGVGIPEELLEKVGKPFFTTKEKGTGLGLMVCHNIVESHNGTLKIESEKGKGTKMSIYLPIFN